MTLLRSLMRYVAFMAMSALSFSTLTYSSPHLSGHTFLYSSLIPAAAGDCPVAQNLTVISYTTGDVIVTWDHPVSGPPSEGYSLRFNYILPDGTIDYSGNVGGNPNIPSSSTSITDELTPGYTYRAILVAEDNFCGNTPYAFYDFEIPLPQNCEPVRDPSASDITNSSVRLYWNHPTDVSDIQNYILRYSEVGGSDNGSTTVGLNSTNAAITGLQSSTTYSTQVCTLCDDGTETCVNAGTITTQSDQQYSCSQLQVDIIGGNGSICQGTEITLKTDVRYGSGPYEYDWSNGKTTSQITVTPNSGTAYYSVTVTDANNCTDSDIVSFYVSAPSTNDAEPEITTAATMTCGNSLVSLSVNDGSTQASQALQAYYPFQADMADHSGNNRNLSGDRGILTGGGLQLLSSGTAISSPVISSAQYYQTVSFYLKFLETPNGSRQKIFSFEPSNLESPSIWKRANDMGIDWQYDSQNKGSFGDFNLTLNRWYHIVGRKSGQDFKLYVDGQLEKQVTLSNTYTTSGAPLVFGDAAVVIKEFKFYSRSLSYDEIGGNWVWYTNNSGSSPPIGTGQTIDVLPTATTTYYVRWESNCSYSAWAYHTISVVTPPSIDITAGNTDLCVGNSTNLTASTGGGIGCTTVKWEIKPDGTEDWEPVSGTNTGNTIPVPTDLDPGIYHFRAKYFCSESCGTATSNVITININANERVPTITGTPEPVCSGGTIQLRVEDATTEDASLQVFYPFENDLNDHLGSLHLTGSGGTLTGEGLQLTNSSAYASPYTDILDTDEHTISFDIKYNSGFDELAYHRIFYFNPLNSDRSPGIFRHRWNNGIHWRYSPGNYGVATGADLGVNQWHSIVGVKDGPLFTLYVDGHFVESASVPDPKSEGSGYLRFGGSEVVIRNFKAYNRSFTAKEIVGEWAWYTSNDPNSAPFDYGAEIEVSPDVTTTYYVRWLNDCGTSAPAEITVDVTADPSVTISEENADPPTLPIGICEGETRTLTASLSGGLDCNQPQWWSRVGTSGTWIATGNFTTELVVTADLAPGNYQYLVKYTCNGLGCEVATSN
ncbi:MAG: fibronectin type III domain-containing protein, partial [Lewinella sp.]|nr:fibronectin type III domain-containing protein [Lewinella sp.]